MEEEPSIETVHQALVALYKNPDNTGKERASVWLGELQKSVYGWQIADKLLRMNQSLESCYFGAQTMRSKIQYAFHELPADSHLSLRDSLLDHASKITAVTPVVIVTQLSLALVDLALQMASWKSAVQDLIEKFSKEHLGFLLEILTVLPEEINSRSLRLGANRRKEIVDELQSACPTVIQLLIHINTTSVSEEEKDQRIRGKTFKALGSWFSVGAISQEHILSTQLLNFPFQVLVNTQCPAFLHEAAADCICSALYCAEDLARYNDLAQQLFQGIMALVPAYQQADKEEELDKCLNYCRIFTDLSESLFDNITSTPNQGLGTFQLLDLLLMCVGHHLYEVGEITFNFWYRLSEDLYQKNIQEMTDMFCPYIQNLILSLGQHCQMDEDHEGIPEESGDFHDFRVRVSELIKDVVFIAGSSSCFVQMFENLKSPKCQSWAVSEASLFTMTAVAKNILPQENEIVPQVVQAILTMPATTHLAVGYTSIQLLGELAEWIEHHPQLLDSTLQYLFSGLQQPQLASIVASSLQNMAIQCPGQMKDHFHGLMHTVQSLESFNLSSDAAIGLLIGTATVLACLPTASIPDAMRQLCACQVTPLEKLMNETEGPVRQGAANDPTKWLDRLAAIFKHASLTVTNGQLHPCHPVIMEVWPVASKACEKYQADVRIIERCCRCIRFVIRCLGKSSATLLSPLVTQMVSLYQAHQHSCFLYLGSILVDEYGSEAGCIPGLLDMLQAFCGPTFRILEEHNGLRSHPDTVDDMFRLCLRFVQRAPVPFLSSAMAKPLMCCAIAACSLDHKDANASVMKFLTDLIRCMREKKEREDFQSRHDLTKKLLEEHGQSLVVALMNASLFCLPTFMCVEISEVLYELLKTDKQTFSSWLENTLKSLPTQSTGGAVTATKDQMADFHKACSGAGSVKELGKAVREFCRLYR